MAKIKLYYAGKRFYGDKISHLFYFENGEEAGYWTRAKGAWIGEAYWAEQKGENISMKQPCESAMGEGDEPHKNADEWRSLSWAAESEAKRNSRRRRLDTGKELIREVAILKNYVAKLSYTEKREFVSWLVDEFEREEREETNRKFNERIKRISSHAAREIAKARKEAKNGKEEKKSDKPS
jgi:hypothetical protein